MNTEDRSAYSKGYAAGRKRTELETARVEAMNSETRRRLRERRDRLFCTALQAIITSPSRWTMNGETVWKQADYIKLALSIADESVRVLGD